MRIFISHRLTIYVIVIRKNCLNYIIYEPELHFYFDFVRHVSARPVSVAEIRRRQRLKICGFLFGFRTNS